MSFFAMKKSGQAPKIMIQSNRSENHYGFSLPRVTDSAKRGAFECRKQLPCFCTHSFYASPHGIEKYFSSHTPNNTGKAEVTPLSFLLSVLGNPKTDSRKDIRHKA